MLLLGFFFGGLTLTFIAVLRKLLGISRNLDHITSKMEEIFPQDKGRGFTTALKDKLLVVFNETQAVKGNLVKNEVLDAITRKENNIKELYVSETLKQTNFIMRMVLMTNETPTPLVDHDDRRVFVIKVNDMLKEIRSIGINSMRIWQMRIK